MSMNIFKGPEFDDGVPELRTLCDFQFPAQDSKLCDTFQNPAEEEIIAGSKKRHVFASIWERPLVASCGGPSPYSTWTVDYHSWPPQTAKVSDGIKIPVSFSPNMDLHVMEATPNASTCFPYAELKGIMNPCESRAIVVYPPALLFLNSKPGQFYSTKLTVTNVDTVISRVKIVPPKNPVFLVSTKNTTPAISPGLSMTIKVEYRPKTNQPMNDVLFIAVEDAGGVSVPLIAAIEPPPILEFDEWDCGSGVVGVPKILNIPIKNVGTNGKFWILSEEEFRNQVLKYPKDKKNEKRQSIASMSTGPFTLMDTVAFKLMRNQRIQLKLKFTPPTPGLHLDKLAIMCDNGEMRWIGVKGKGIVMDRRIFEFTYLLPRTSSPIWPAPPVDFNFDEGARYALDFGDLWAIEGHEEDTRDFNVENKSCVDVFYFWGVRSLISPAAGGCKKGGQGKLDKFRRLVEGMEGSEEAVDAADNHRALQEVDINVNMAQGILHQGENLNFAVSLKPVEKVHSVMLQEGYYACVLSFYMHQLDSFSGPLAKRYIEKLNKTGPHYSHFINVPIHIDTLRQLFETEENGSESTDENDSNEDRECYKYLKSIIDEAGDKQTKDIDKVQKLMARTGVTEKQEMRKDEFPLKDLRELLLERHEKKKSIGSEQEEADNNVSLLPQPIVEMEIWFRSLPLEVTFTPPFINSYGPVNSKIERIITVSNRSQFPVEIEFDQLTDSVATVCVQPPILLLEPDTETELSFVICLKSHGKVTEDFKGTLSLPNYKSKSHISIPCNITCNGPYLATPTPVIHFGCIPLHSQKMKTIAIQNKGNKKATWGAEICKELHDEFERNLTPYSTNIESLNLLRVWPTWGSLEPGEMRGINIYFDADIEGNITSSVKIQVEDVPDSTIFVSICAMVQAPLLYLQESEVTLDIQRLKLVGTQEIPVTLLNPTGFPVNFAWLPCLFGKEGLQTDDFIQTTFCPESELVPPKGMTTVILTFQILDDIFYTALKDGFYALCLAEGMKEPVLLKISSKEKMDACGKLISELDEEEEAREATRKSERQQLTEDNDEEEESAEPHNNPTAEPRKTVEEEGEDEEESDKRKSSGE